MATQTTLSNGQPALTLSSGAAMPAIGLGTWKSPAEKVKQAVLSAVRNGYRHIDCASLYMNEGVIGEALQELFKSGEVKREDLFITSKLWITDADPAHVADALTKTLADLQLEYLDLYLIHFPIFLKHGATFPPANEDRLGWSLDSFRATWKELEKEVQKGRAKHIGVSNMNVPKLKQFLPHAEIKPAVNQIELHPYLSQQQLVDFCHENNIVVTAYSPLGSPDRPDIFAEGQKPLLENSEVNAIAKAHGATPAQVLIKWAVQRNTVVIPKSVTPERIVQNLESYKLNLSDKEMQQLNALDSNIRYVTAHVLIPEDKSRSYLWDE